MKKHFFYLLFFCIAASLQGYSGIGPTQPPIDTLLDIPAPRFSMLDTNGKTVSLSDFKNKVLVVYFWSTWCYYCHKDFPMINKVVKQYANDTTVAFLFVDTREKSDQYKELVQKDMVKNNYNFHVVFDEKGKDSLQNKYYTQFGTIGIPTRFVIDRNMVIRHKFVGYDPDVNEEQAAAAFSRSIEDTKKLASHNKP
ncbi:TlpA family protein disulfide reductase [Chitinophaga pinensis]|uniref:Alkyl hydroperoxide reductase/ Thiol specific antioxidant/ Mal allergen n=1 Tax=Chitinophaga pinensis (strain ATCC 43595 / DSM 2588 / LMG 13176 / NBRC 15968 / NCIMB 11800 / UQM 2034) TaxID=485918 RepID=A0A979GM37_CHIPD|nr:TlpA disulfide reductase family protein [Chitinophaga pinensis]ACU57757.1 alkyl hydroperoxide reductase/ Thiol specific antioxidant/ Mal allergen [Chitinophaga pinensis DSM 2588]